MGPPVVVAVEPAIEAGLQDKNGCVFVQIEFLVRHAATQPLDDDVIYPAAFAIHADTHIKLE